MVSSKGSFIVCVPFLGIARPCKFEILCHWYSDHFINFVRKPHLRIHDCTCAYSSHDYDFVTKEAYILVHGISMCNLNFRVVNGNLRGALLDVRIIQDNTYRRATDCIIILLY